MIKNLVLVSFIIVSLFISSCSNLIYFTNGIRENLDENQLEIEKVQYYNSEKIVLRRSLSKEETQIAKGIIKLEDGNYFEEIIIPKQTKGIAVSTGSEYLKIAFERGDNRNLRFVLNDDNMFQISADCWKNNYGCVSYDTSTYYVIPSSSNTLLMVSKEYISNIEKKRRVLEGVNVGR